MRMNPLPLVGRVRELLSYDPKTGDLRRKISRWLDPERLWGPW
jgi:hypothetical protein